MDGLFARGLLPALGLALACAGVLPQAARASMYECKGPDGKTLYTSNASLCPGASVHVPTGHVVHTHDTAEPAAPSGRNAVSAADQQALAAPWRAKKQHAEARLQKVSALLTKLDKAEGWCNRGNSLYREDENGIRHDYSCKKVRSRQQALSQEQAKLQKYLSGGLAEECRKAGCLPGWIR